MWQRICNFRRYSIFYKKLTKKLNIPENKKVKEYLFSLRSVQFLSNFLNIHVENDFLDRIQVGLSAGNPKKPQVTLG